jgi:probable phosphoglycerate mutase
MVPTRETNLVVIRHGETVWNRQRRIQGHGDSPLTAAGRAQARAVGRRVAETPFDALVASDLGRAVETAEHIASRTGHRIVTDPRLRERHYGHLEGLTEEEVRERHGGMFEALMADDPDWSPPGGESHRQHFQRVVAMVEEWIRHHPSTTTVFVAHGGVLDILFRFVARLPLERPRCFVIPNAGLSIFAHGTFYGTQRWVIRTWGDTGHLDPIGTDPGLG